MGLRALLNTLPIGPNMKDLNTLSRYFQALTSLKMITFPAEIASFPKQNMLFSCLGTSAARGKKSLRKLNMICQCSSQSSTKITE